MTLYKSQRQDIEAVFIGIYRQVVRLADKLDVEPCSPRTSTGRQQNRCNTPAQSPEEWY